MPTMFGVVVEASASGAEWRQSQDALRDEVGRVCTLLRSVDDPGPAKVVGQWSLAEVAMHLSQAWLVIPGLARRDLSAVQTRLPERLGAAGDSVARDVADLDDVTTAAVRSDPERDLSVLADRIEARAQDYFDDCARHSPDEPRPWLLQGITMPLAAFTGHLLQETAVHGYDIARAAGRRWRIEPAHAAMIFQRFLIPVLAAADPRQLGNAQRLAGVRASYELRIRGGDRFHFLIEDGALRVTTVSGRPVDCRISADPATLLLLVFHRPGAAAAIARGRLVAWGRKPWLAPRLVRYMPRP